MKRLLLVILFAGIGAATLQAQKKTFTREYTYQASEDDSRNSARANATTQMRNILLSEVGQYLHVERTLERDDTSEEFSQKIEAITAGIVEMKTLDEQWDGSTYYIKAEMAVDPKDLERRIAEVLNDKQKTQELEEARKRTLAAEAENARLRKELEETKNEQQRLDLQKTYAQAADVLSAEEYFTKGNNAKYHGFYELAIEYYQKTIKLAPNYAEAYYNMGNAYRGLAYHNLEDYNEAIQCYQKAVAIDQNYTEAYSDMAYAYERLKNYSEAIQCWQKVLELDPNKSRCYYNMGTDYYNLEDYKGAIRCFQKILELDPNDKLAYYLMGLAYDGLKNYHEAIRCCQKAVAIDSNYVEAYFWIAHSYISLENYAAATLYFAKVIALDPNDAWAYYYMGDSLGKLGFGIVEERIKNYQQAARLGNSKAQAWLRENGYSW